MEEIGKDFHGYIGNIKAYNKALEPDMIRTDAADVTEVNVALNRNAYSERFGNQPDLNTGLLKYHRRPRLQTEIKRMRRRRSRPRIRTPTGSAQTITATI